MQDRLGFLASNIEVALQNNMVLRQRAGFIRAQHIHRPEILNGIKAFDDHFAARHRHSTLGEIDGNDHRQHFRRKPDGNRYRKHQGFQPIMLG